MQPDPVTPEERWIRDEWIQTYTGRRFYPGDPRAAHVDPHDIAHALSLLCRYGGHVRHFYSVAEHSVLMSQVVRPEHALAALLHDATEAYMVDLPRPLKLMLPEYQVLEERVWSVIARFFGLELELPREVKDVDSAILIDERNRLMPNAERWAVDDRYAPLGVPIACWGPMDAEQAFLDRLDELTTPLQPAEAR